MFRALADKTDVAQLLADDALNGVQPFHRRAAFVHSFATGEAVPLELPDSVRYVDVANSRLQYTLARGERSRRYRVRNNLLGTSRFCPQVFRVPDLVQAVANDSVAGWDPWRDCPPEIRDRVVQYLYHQETRSTWKIESETPRGHQTQRFVDLLEAGQETDFITPARLSELQAVILGRVPDSEHPWRTRQVWVGHADRYWNEVINLLGAPPGSIPHLMDGLMSCHRRLMQDGSLPPVLHAACVGFALVYIHPFLDGNGRVHRFLLHNVLAQRGYVPPDTLFPLSAWLLNHRREYIGCMSDTCRGILAVADWEWQADGALKVLNDIESGFRYLDLTGEALALYRFLEASVREELEPGIEFITRFDKALSGLNDLVDWPYPQQSLFIRLCVQNGGRLSRRKRNLPAFRGLSDSKVAQLEASVREAYGLGGDGEGQASEPPLVRVPL